MKTASRSRLTLVALTGFGCFMAGVILSNFAHLAACPLCILQRMLYLSLGLVALLSRLLKLDLLGQHSVMDRAWGAFPLSSRPFGGRIMGSSHAGMAPPVHGTYVRNPLR